MFVNAFKSETFFKYKQDRMRPKFVHLKEWQQLLIFKGILRCIYFVLFELILNQIFSDISPTVFSQNGDQCPGTLPRTS